MAELNKIWYGWETTADIAKIYGYSRRYMLKLLVGWYEVDKLIEKLLAFGNDGKVRDMWKNMLGITYHDQEVNEVYTIYD